MRRAHYLSVAALGIAAVMSGAKADPVLPEAPVNPYIQTDGDGIPLAVANPRSVVHLSAEDQEQISREGAKAEADKNWLMRGYEKQLKLHAAANPSEDQGTNLYYELGKNKALAKLAGISDIDSDDDSSAKTAADRAAEAAPKPGAVAAAQYQQVTPASTIKPIPDLFAFKPFLTPFASPGSAGLHSVFTSLPITTPTPLAGPSQTSATTEVAAKSPASEETDINTPGMIAAQKDPLSNLEARDLTLDVLPGQTSEQAMAVRESNNSLDLPQAMNLEQYHRALPVVPTTDPSSSAKNAKTPPVVPVASKADTEEDPDAPIPVNREPVITPVHSAIANPYDILNR